jgi:hypothetical protein
VIAECRKILEHDFFEAESRKGIPDAGGFLIQDAGWRGGQPAILTAITPAECRNFFTEAGYAT